MDIVNKIKCLLGIHDWFRISCEYRESEYSGVVTTSTGKKHCFDGHVIEDRCAECGYERIMQHGYTSVRKPWKMAVRNKRWDKEKREYVT